MAETTFNLWLERDEDTFRARLTDASDHELARHAFTLELKQLNTQALRQRVEEGATATKAREAAVTAGTDLGRRLYDAAFGGSVGQAFTDAQRQAEQKREPIRLRLRVGPGELLNLPWELLHDGARFLLPACDLFLSRTPADLPELQAQTAPLPLKILVVISNPLDLPESQQLDTDREEEIIGQALDGLVRSRQAIVEFVEEATEEEMRRILLADTYHVLHFVGHGNFDARTNRGLVVIENEDGDAITRDSEQIASLWGTRTMRLALLSSCLTARTSETNAYGGVAQALLKRGIPAVVAMQYSVFEESALTLWRTFYAALAAGKPLDESLSEARRSLSLTGTDNLEWATPTLYLRGEAAWNLVAPAPPDAVPPSRPAGSAASEAFGELLRLDTGFVGRRREIRQIRRGLLHGAARLALIHGFGGIGKTVLATRVAEKLLASGAFKGVLGISVRRGLTSEQTLKEFNDYLLRNGVQDFDAVMRSDAPPAQKAQYLGQLLRQIPLLVIFDNAEDWLIPPEPSSETASTPDYRPIARHTANPDIADLLRNLITAASEGSKFLLTSRYDFDVLPRGRAGTTILRVPLGELSRIETIRLLGRLDTLADCDWNQRRIIYEGVGGHPFTLNLFAERAADVGVEFVLSDLRNVQREAMDTFLLNQIFTDSLSQQGRDLLCRMSVLRRAAPKECLDKLMGTHRIETALDELRRWGLMVRIKANDEVSEAEEDRYQMHALVREFAQERLAAEKRDALAAAAAFYEGRAEKTRYLDIDVFNRVEAQHYRFEAGEYEQAADQVEAAQKYLARWGFRSLAMSLLQQSAKTTTGTTQAYAQINLAIRLYEQGEIDTATQLYTQALQVLTELGDKSGIATSLHNLAAIQQAQGNLAEAARLYNESLLLRKELGDKSGIATSLHELGRLEQAQGNLAEAARLYNESLQIARELGDKSGIAASLHNLAAIQQAQGNLAEAARLYNESLQIARELGDKSGIAASLHNLAMLQQEQGNLVEAARLYNESLLLRKELGDKSGIATSLHELGRLEQAQGNLAEAARLYNESLQIARELGDKSGIAASLHNLAMLQQEQGNLAEAARLYNESLQIARELGDKSGIAASLHNLAAIQQAQGNLAEAARLYNESLQIARELGDKSGIATSLHELGRLEQAQGNLVEAARLYNESLLLRKELGDKSGIATSLHELGRLEQAQGNLAEAARLYNESLLLRKELGDKSGIAGSLHQLAMLQQDQGNLAEAARLYNESLQIKRELGDKSGIAGSLHQLAMLQQAQGNLTEATRLYNESLQIKRELGNKSGIAITVGQMGRLYQQQGRLREALLQYVTSWDAFRQLQSPNARLVQTWIGEVRQQAGEENFQTWLREDFPSNARQIVEILDAQ